MLQSMERIFVSYTHPAFRTVTGIKALRGRTLTSQGGHAGLWYTSCIQKMLLSDKMGDHAPSAPGTLDISSTVSPFGDLIK